MKVYILQNILSGQLHQCTKLKNDFEVKDLKLSHKKMILLFKQNNLTHIWSVPYHHQKRK